MFLFFIFLIVLFFDFFYFWDLKCWTTQWVKPFWERFNPLILETGHLMVTYRWIIGISQKKVSALFIQSQDTAFSFLLSVGPSQCSAYCVVEQFLCSLLDQRRTLHIAPRLHLFCQCNPILCGQRRAIRSQIRFGANNDEWRARTMTAYFRDPFACDVQEGVLGNDRITNEEYIRLPIR